MVSHCSAKARICPAPFVVFIQAARSNAPDIIVTTGGAAIEHVEFVYDPLKLPLVHSRSSEIHCEPYATNDAWYGYSTGPFQHLETARARAIEEGLPVVRVANSGVSAVFDPLGRKIGSIALNQEGILDSKLPQNLPPTIYARYGRFIWIGMLLVASCCLILFVKGERHGHHPRH